MVGCTLKTVTDKKRYTAMFPNLIKPLDGLEHLRISFKKVGKKMRRGLFFIIL